MIEIQGVNLSDESLELLREWNLEKEPTSEFLHRELENISDLFLDRHGEMPQDIDILNIVMVLRDVRRSISILSNHRC